MEFSRECVCEHPPSCHPRLAERSSRYSHYREDQFLSLRAELIYQMPSFTSVRIFNPPCAQWFTNIMLNLRETKRRIKLIFSNSNIVDLKWNTIQTNFTATTDEIPIAVFVSRVI